MSWYYRSGELTRGPWDVVVDPADNPGWRHTGFRAARVHPSSALHLAPNTSERLIFILEGEEITVSYTLHGKIDVIQKKLRGRHSVFDGPTDSLYLPLGTEITINGDARIAIAEAPARVHKDPALIAREDVPVLLRGAGEMSRQVHNIGMPEILDADRLIVVEVIVPAGNWSGAPAHKHDTYVPGEESNLEEIYFFHAEPTRTVPSLTSPFGIFRGYASDNRPYEITQEVHSGDVVLVPHGWHGPVAAGPGYDLYFCNVMAGPDPTREWNVTDEPSQLWMREAWKDMDVDSRLPYQSVKW
jgi:5-deoxy-glucuronate isomerase